MEKSELMQIEQLCEVVYSGSRYPLLEQLDAQRHLLRLQSSIQYLPTLQSILENSNNNYALLFASKSLLNIVTNDWRNMSSPQRLQLQHFILQRLTTQMDPNHFVAKALVHVLCRLTKMGWVSDPDLRNIVSEVIQFVNAGVPHAILGLRIIIELVGEFEMGRRFADGRIDADARYAAQAFREHSGLTRAFTVAHDTVVKVFQEPPTPENKWILKESLRTLEACLSYDFIGTGYSESDDVVACLYIPVEWTSHVANAESLKRLFNIYFSQWQNSRDTDVSEEGTASLALQCIALLAATRRSVFDEPRRYEFLVALLDGSTKLMQEKTGLAASEACLHHLCRLLSRMKSHFQLVELAKPPQYHLWLQTLCGFTEEVFNSWRSVSSRTVHYLVRLWGALVLPTPYLRMRDGLGSQPNYLAGLDTFVPRIVQVFIASRADMCSAIALEELGFDTSKQGLGRELCNDTGAVDDDPMDDEGMLLEQLTPLSILARFRYSVSAPAIGELYIQALNMRQNAMKMIASRGDINEAMKSLTDAQARLAFLTYVLASIIGGHVTRVSARVIENLEELNAELAALVFRMIVESQQAEDAILSMGQRPAELIFHSSVGWQLELASLYFFRCFQTLYIESRAREDEIDRSRQQFVEDNMGYVTLRMGRRPGVASIMQDNENPQMSIQSLASGLVPRVTPSLDMLGRGLVGLLSRQSHMGRMTMDSEDDDVVVSISGSGANNNGIVVDELSASEIAAKEQKVNDEATARAAAMQQSIASRVGIAGGDRALLDIAMRRIFGLLQYAQSVRTDDAASAPVVIVERALSVLYQLSVGVTIVHAGRTHSPKLMSSGRLLLESDVIQDLLNNPSADRFPLLREVRHGRARSFLLATLSKLLFTQSRYPITGDMQTTLTPQDQAEERFVSFMNPMTDVVDRILNMAENGMDIRNNNDAKVAFIGFTRDLRGVISSVTGAREYELIFAWLYPKRIRVLALGAQLWSDNLEIMIPLLKLLAELVHNRGSRIVFPLLSAGGLVLFRESTTALVAFCGPLLQSLEKARLQASQSQLQKDKIKDTISKSGNGTSLQQLLGSSLGNSGNDPMSMQALQAAVAAMGEELFSSDSSSKDKSESSVIDMGPNAVGPGYTVDLDVNELKCSRVCLTTMTRLLNGRYAPLGAFELFGDSSLDDARRVILELAVSGSPKHIMSFPKMARALIVLLNLMSDKYLIAMVNVSSAHFARIMACLGEAIISGQTAISTPAAATVEALAQFKCRARSFAFQEQSQQGKQDPLIRIRTVLNPAHRSRGDVTSADEYIKAAQLFQMHENAHPNLFPSMLSLIMGQLFDTVTPQDSPNQWSLAKPIMPLVLSCPHEFEKQRVKFLSGLSASREPRVRDAFDSLFSKLGPALSNPSLFNMILSTNDTFTKQLCTFCLELQRE